MAWRRPGDKPLSEPMMVRSPTHICVARPQWVNTLGQHRSWDREACCLMAPSNSLTQCWLLNIYVQWQSPECSFTRRDNPAINYKNVVHNYLSKMHSNLSGNNGLTEKKETMRSIQKMIVVIDMIGRCDLLRSRTQHAVLQCSDAFWVENSVRSW